MSPTRHKVGGRLHLVESVSFRSKRVECTCGEELTIDPEVGPPQPFANEAERNFAVAELFRRHRRDVGLRSLGDHVFDTEVGATRRRWASG